MLSSNLAVEVFCSYAHADKKLLRQLETQLSGLKRQGLISLWHDRAILPGSSWAETIDGRLKTASVILLLISADFVASDYCYGIEMSHALERHDANEARVIPIILRPVNWKGLPFAHLVGLPHNAKPVTTWKNRDEAFADIARGLRDVIAEMLNSSSLTLAATVSLSRVRQPIWYVPHHRNPFFTGREEVLASLHRSLTPSTTVVLTQAQAISGLGGIGKTQTANEYAHRYVNEYTAILWVRAEKEELVSSDYAKIAELLGSHINEKENPIAHIETVKRWLSMHSNWLLIFDNVENLYLVQQYTPTLHQGHVLLTTRAQVTEPIASNYVLEGMEEAEAILFCLQRAKFIVPRTPLDCISQAERQSASTLWREMDGLPLALDQAAAFILEMGCSFSRYLNLFRKRKAELLALRGQFDSDHPESVMTTFSLLFEKITLVNPLAADLLQLCTFLNPDLISEEIIEYVFRDRDILLLYKAIRDLSNYSLLRRKPKPKELSIHRLIQVALRVEMDNGTSEQWKRLSYEAVLKLHVYPVVDSRPHNHMPPPPFNEYDVEMQNAGRFYLASDNQPFAGFRIR